MGASASRRGRFSAASRLCDPPVRCLTLKPLSGGMADRRLEANVQDYAAGMTWGWVGVRGTWDTPESGLSMTTMAEALAVNWVAIAFAALQDGAESTEIHWRDSPTVTDDEVRAEIARAQLLGLKVCLKPVVNCADGTWRAHINFFDIEVPLEPK